MAKTVEFER